MAGSYAGGATHRRAVGTSGVAPVEAAESRVAIDNLADELRLYLEPARNGDLLEIVSLARDEGSELVIHAMALRPKYQRLLPGD